MQWWANLAYKISLQEVTREDWIMSGCMKRMRIYNIQWGTLAVNELIKQFTIKILHSTRCRFTVETVITSKIIIIIISIKLSKEFYLGNPWGFIIKSGHIPRSENGKSSCWTMVPQTPFCPCLLLNLSPTCTHQ